MTSRQSFLATSAAALVAVACLGACGAATPGASPAGGGEPGTNRPSPSPASSASRSASLAVYYLGNERIWLESGGSPIDRVKLYREFHRLAVHDDSPAARTTSAVAEMLDGESTYDPDYRSGWPSGARVRQVRVDGDTVTVDLTGAATNNAGAEVAHQAVQQLIWTATAASGQPGVRLLLDGEQITDLWGHVAVGGVLRRPPALDVLAHVWLIDPQHDATVAPTFTIHVSGATSESTVQLRVRQADRTIDERYVTVAAPAAGPVGEARTSLTLPPGTYTIEAYAASGVDGRALFLDDHTVTVR